VVDKTKITLQLLLEDDTSAGISLGSWLLSIEQAPFLITNVTAMYFIVPACYQLVVASL